MRSWTNPVDAAAAGLQLFDAGSGEKIRIKDLSPAPLRPQISSEDSMCPLLLTALSAWVLCVNAPPGLTRAAQSFSCCTALDIPIDRSCENIFTVGNKTAARVTRRFSSVEQPFELIGDSLKLLDCVDFVQKVLCELEDDLESEHRTSFTHTPCHKLRAPEDSAAHTQGSSASVLFLAVTAALVVQMF